MEEQQWAPPIWSKCGPLWEGKRKDLRYTYPDWGNTGPGSTTTTQHSDLWMQSSRSTTESCFTTLKDVKKKFPLRTSCQYSYPLLKPQRCYSHSCVHHPLVGNCLDVVEVGDQTTVLHVDLSSSHNQQTVVASKLKCGRYYQNDEPIRGDPLFHLEKQDNVVVDQYVHQVVSKSLHNDVHVLVRCPTKVYLASLGQPGFIKDKLETLGDSLTSDAALSSVVPGLWSLVTASGEVTLHDAEARDPLWGTQCRQNNKLKNELTRTFRCDFGRHPLYLYIGNESSLWLYDTRIEPCTFRPLFDLKQSNDYIPVHEHICSFVPGNDQPHVYVVMDESVYVVDNRQPKTPLMYWRHMLPEKPTHSTLKRLDSLEILMLSCTQNKEVCMITSEWECGGQQCYGVGVPRHFPILRDTADFAHSRSLWFTSQVQERLEDTARLGTASVSHPVESDGLLFLSLHSSGDIFSHSFQTLDTKTKSSISLEDKHGEAILDKWEGDVVEVSTHNWSSQDVKYFDATHFLNQVMTKPSCRYVEEMLAGLPDIKFKHLHGSTNGIESVGSKTDKNKQIFTNSKKSAKTGCRKIPLVKKSTTHNEKYSHKMTSNLWNLKDQVQKYRNHSTSRSSRSGAWNKALMDTYIIDPIVDPSCSLSVPTDDSVTEDSLSKYLPESMIKDLKIDQIKSCEDFLSSKIISLWLDENNSNVKEKEAEIEQHGTFDKRLSNLIGNPTPTRRHGFQYHTAPVNLSEIKSARLNAPRHVRNEPSPEPEESCTFPSQATIDSSQNLPSKSKVKLKKLKKRKRVDGF